MYKAQIQFKNYLDHFTVCQWCTENVGIRGWAIDDLNELFTWKYIDKIECFEYYFYKMEDYTLFVLIWL
jgi:hypothetical protein